MIINKIIKGNIRLANEDNILLISGKIEENSEIFGNIF